MKSRAADGFTLIEVVLAIAVGLIIIAGVSVGYVYAKNAAIWDNQRKDAAAIKSWIEQSIAADQAALGQGIPMTTCPAPSGFCPPQFTQAQLGGLAQSLPSMQIDPYSGATRSTGCSPFSGQGTTSCFDAITLTYSCSLFPCPIPLGPTFDPAARGPGGGSSIFYFHADSFPTPFQVTLADGSQSTYFGYVVAEGDADGNLVAAAGGSSAHP